MTRLEAVSNVSGRPGHWKTFRDLARSKETVLALDVHTESHFNVVRTD